MKYDFCFVIPDLLSTTPRALREIDTLLNNGYSVFLSSNARMNHTINNNNLIINKLKKNKNFYYQENNFLYNKIWYVFLSKLIRKLFKKLSEITNNRVIWAGAAHECILWQYWKIRNINAYIYVGHRPASIPILNWLSNKNQAKSWFDIEDDHFQETTNQIENTFLLNFCLKFRIDFYTNASKYVGISYLSKLGINQISTEILNSPNVSDNIQIFENQGKPKFFWFSQTVASGRGLEIFFESMRSQKLPYLLTIVGKVDFSYQDFCNKQLLDNQEIEWKGFVKESEILDIATNSDFGLALEIIQGNKNRDICITNKISLFLFP